MSQVFTCLDKKCGSGLLAPPNELDEILATFGDHSEYLRPDGTLDPKWQSEFLATTTSPFPMLLAWDRTKYISHSRATDY
ncbi:MAG: hypothetical protein QOD84_2779 [Acidobacteriaceae bacterium]|jgi:hypothetical protein